ncbi:DMT family transporter [Desulfospira joergensenii]|uniref:DMT family transporter n=1 Tax=Desulfospira joergensenii TaxID=53329 RepID=UPI0003B765E2|nr:DMT family transporter [Desulfospira joergensenii]
MNVKTLLGCLSIFASAFFFYLATVIIKWSKVSGLTLDSAMFVIARFGFGFVTVVLVMALGKKKIRIRKKRLLVGRALGNASAVYCFFKAVDLTTVAQANILNMTYPLFIAVFSWIFLKAQRDWIAVLIVLTAFVGVWLILSPGTMSYDINSLWGLGSGIFAAFAIMYLNLARQVHDTHTTLFFMFGLGGAVIFCLFFNKMVIPTPGEMKYLFWCSAIAIAGQYLMTIGFKFVSAIEGGIISSTRILLAAILGPFLATDPAMTLSGWVGAFLIFSGNVYLTLRKARKKTNPL